MNDERQDPIAGGFQSRADFEAALPLFVGGDLTPEEARRVELWAEEHPEDAGALVAAEAAHGTPRGPRREGSCVRRPGSVAVAPGAAALGGAPRSGDDVARADPLARLDRGTRAERSPPRRRSLLCGGLAGLLALGGGSERWAAVRATRASVTFTGTEGRPAAVRFANAPKAPAPAEPEAEGAACVRPGARPSTSSSGPFRFPAAR